MQDGTGGHESRMAQKELWEKVLKEYLEINMRMWDGNIKKDSKNFGFTLNSSTITQGQTACFERVSYFLSKMRISSQIL